MLKVGSPPLESPILNLLTLVSHELRTPLTAILGYADILQSDGGQSPSELKEYLGVIQQSARSQCQVIDDLMDASSILFNHLDIDMKVVNILPLALQAIEDLRAETQRRNISIELRTAVSSSMVMGDESRLSQIFHSLLSNAVKFSFAGGVVQITVEVQDRFVVVNVIDQGIGIAENSLEKIFQLFVQGDSSLTRKYGGLGLGLSITKYLVDAHGGNIVAQSAGLGRGANFQFMLPLSTQRQNF